MRTDRGRCRNRWAELGWAFCWQHDLARHDEALVAAPADAELEEAEASQKARMSRLSAKLEGEQARCPAQARRQRVPRPGWLTAVTAGRSARRRARARAAVLMGAHAEGRVRRPRSRSQASKGGSRRQQRPAGYGTAARGLVAHGFADRGRRGLPCAAGAGAETARRPVLERHGRRGGAVRMRAPRPRRPRNDRRDGVRRPADRGLDRAAADHRSGADRGHGVSGRSNCCWPRIEGERRIHPRASTWASASSPAKAREGAG